MINTWENIHGKPEKHVPNKVAVEHLVVSSGGQGPSVGITRMSRGRHKEPGYANSTQVKSPKHHEVRTREGFRRDWYMQTCEVKKKKKETLFQKVGNEIGVERIAKSCLLFADKEPLLKPLIQEVNMPLAKTLVAYLLGHEMPDFSVSLPQLKKELIRARDEFELTTEHFDKMTKMFERAVHALCIDNHTRLLWCTISDCFRKEIEFGNLHKTTDKRYVTWDIVLRGIMGGDKISSDIEKNKIAREICNAAKKSIPDPEISRAINACFIVEDLEILDFQIEDNIKNNGKDIKIVFQIMPEFYEDRITLRQLDLAHQKQFIDSLGNQLVDKFDHAQEEGGAKKTVGGGPDDSLTDRTRTRSIGVVDGVIKDETDGITTKDFTDGADDRGDDGKDDPTAPSNKTRYTCWIPMLNEDGSIQKDDDGNEKRIEVEADEYGNPIEDWQTALWKENAAHCVAGIEGIGKKMAEHSSYDGISLENELELTLSPLKMYPPLPIGHTLSGKLPKSIREKSDDNDKDDGYGKDDGDYHDDFEQDRSMKLVFDEQNRRIEMLEDHLKQLSHIHSKELTRTRKMLILAQDRIQELEEMTNLLPTEAAQAQNLIFRITQDSIRRTLRKGEERKKNEEYSHPEYARAAGAIIQDDEEDDDEDRSSMQIIESCPTPRLMDHLDGGGSRNGGYSPYDSTMGGFNPQTDLHFGMHSPGTTIQNNFMADGLIAQRSFELGATGSRNIDSPVQRPSGAAMMGSPQQQLMLANNTFGSSMYSANGVPVKPPEARLAPGESIDQKLREWIEASQRLLDPGAKDVDDM